MIRIAACLFALLPVIAGDAFASHGKKDRSFFLGLSPGGLSVGYHSKKFSVYGGFREPIGHYALRPRRVWVPARTEAVYVPARFERRRIGRCVQRILVEPAHYEHVFHPGAYKIEYARVWVPAAGCP